jgi:hypothetical protein
MKVKIGNVIIPDAKVKRFIGLESGLPYCMIEVTFPFGIVEDGDLVEAFKANTVLPFECAILKSKVLVCGFGRHKQVRRFTLQELASEVSCNYRLTSYEPKVGKEKAIVVPDNLKRQYDLAPEELRLLPFIRLILKDDIPKTCLNNART